MAVMPRNNNFPITYFPLRWYDYNYSEITVQDTTDELEQDSWQIKLLGRIKTPLMRF